MAWTTGLSQLPLGILQPAAGHQHQLRSRKDTLAVSGAVLVLSVPVLLAELGLDDVDSGYPVLPDHQW